MVEEKSDSIHRTLRSLYNKELAHENIYRL